MQTAIGHDSLRADRGQIGMGPVAIIRVKAWAGGHAQGAKRETMT
jgi:hypothetical protein